MGKIIISLPSDTSEYSWHKYSWSQNCYFIYHGMVNNFGSDKVIFVPYNQIHSYNFAADDLLVSTCAYMPVKAKKIIFVGGGSFEDSKWFHGSYIKYGYNVNFMGPTCDFGEQIKRCSAFLVQTNDVSINKWNNNHEDVKQCKQWYIENKINVLLMQHPIDKAYYGSLKQNNNFHKIKFLVYWGGMPKDASKLIELLQYLGYKENEHYDVYKCINTEKSSMIELLQKYAIMTHTSYLEGFPYLINEFMTAGMLPFCTEEWWNGYGYDWLTWSYNPEMKEKNIAKIKFLLDPQNLATVLEMKYNVWAKHWNRTDNTWEYFNSVLANEIRKCL